MDLCNYCGQGAIMFVNPDGTGACPQCYAKFNTCHMCNHGPSCAFETDPSPIPKQIQQVVRQGNMTMQQVIQNPERVKLFCFNCPCFDTDDLVCNKRTCGTCRYYDEFVPPPHP